MPETTALGAAMAAGAAEGVGVWSLNPADFTAVTSERFEPQINPEGKEETHIRYPLSGHSSAHAGPWPIHIT